MSTARLIASNTIFQFLGKVVTMTLTIVSTALITRAYGVEGYGAFSLMVSFPAFFYILADFGFNAIATRDLAVNESKINSYLGNIIVIRFGIALSLIMIGEAILYFLPYSPLVKMGIHITLWTVLFTALQSTSNIAFQVKHRYDLSNLAIGIASLVNFIPLAYFVLTNQSLVFTSFFVTSSYFTTVLLAFVFLRKLKISPEFLLDKELIKSLIIGSLPLGLMFIFSQINFKADSIMLSIMNLPASFGLNNIETVGIYGLPYRIFEVALIVPTFFMNSTYPVMVRHFSESKEKFLITFKKSLLVLGIAGVVCALGGFVFSDLAIRILGAGSFSQSTLILQILLGTIVIFYLTQPVSYLIVTLGGQKHLPLIYLIAAVVNVTLNYIYIPKYSYMASVHITWITELLILTLLIITARYLWRRA